MDSKEKRGRASITRRRCAADRCMTIASRRSDSQRLSLYQSLCWQPPTSGSTIEDCPSTPTVNEGATQTRIHDSRRVYRGGGGRWSGFTFEVEKSMLDLVRLALAAGGPGGNLSAYVNKCRLVYTNHEHELPRCLHSGLRTSPTFFM